MGYAPTTKERARTMFRTGATTQEIADTLVLDLERVAQMVTTVVRPPTPRRCRCVDGPLPFEDEGDIRCHHCGKPCDG